MKTLDCPKGHGLMDLKTIKKELTFKGVDINIETEAYICPECGLEAGTLQSAGALQLAIADAYRTKQNLLISTEIKEFRKWIKKKLSES